MTDRITVYRSRSGTLHQAPTCSGAGPRNTIKRVVISESDYDLLWTEINQATGNLIMCRCLRYTTRGQALAKAELRKRLADRRSTLKGRNAWR